MDFLQQKQQIKISDLRIGNVVYYGAVQSHIITGINYDELTVKIRPDSFYTSGRANQSNTILSSKTFNKTDIVVGITKIHSNAISLKDLNDYGFTWIDAYSVFYLIDNNKFVVESANEQYADIRFSNDEIALQKRVYSLHELQNNFKLASGVDFINIDKF